MFRSKRPSSQKNRLPILVPCLVLCVTLVYPQTQDRKITIANSYWVNLRSSPQIEEGNRVGRVVLGTQLRLIQREEDWYEVEFPEGETAWVHADYAHEDITQRLLKVEGDVVRIRERPSLESDVVLRAIENQLLHYRDESGNWYRIEMPGLGEGWIRKDFVSEDSDPRAYSHSGNEGSLAELERQPQIQQPPEPFSSQQLTTEEEVQNTESMAEGTDEGSPISEDIDLQAEAAPHDAATEPVEMDQGPAESLTENGESDPASSGVEREASKEVPETTMILLPFFIFAGALFLAGAILLWMRRNSVSSVESSDLNPGSSRSRSSLLSIAEGYGKECEKLEKKIQKRLLPLKEESGLDEKNVSGDFDDKIEKIRTGYRVQQEKLDLYRDIVLLQSEQLELLKRENKAIRQVLGISSNR